MLTHLAHEHDEQTDAPTERVRAILPSYAQRRALKYLFVYSKSVGCGLGLN